MIFVDSSSDHDAPTNHCEPPSSDTRMYMLVGEAGSFRGRVSIMMFLRDTNEKSSYIRCPARASPSPKTYIGNIRPDFMCK